MVHSFINSFFSKKYDLVKKIILSFFLECSNKVKSELCLPILDPTSGKVLGIIDAESWQTNYFTPERILDIAQIGYDLGKINLGCNP